jgi:hypothetical protein
MLKKDKLQIIRQCYPNAITTIDSVNSLIRYVEDELEIEPSKIMLADSFCSDDVNSIQYPVRAQEFLGPFKMGGLDGFPFTGLTGMGAFASHFPDTGAIVIYYGPHIGITKIGTLGEINRVGQSKSSGCCGAAKAATAKLMNNEIAAGNITELDYQMNTLEQILLKERDKIVAAKTPLYEATKVIYDAIDKRINELVQRTSFACSYIILMGVILINSDSDIGSFTSLRKSILINLSTGVKTNIINELEPKT